MSHLSVSAGTVSPVEYNHGVSAPATDTSSNAHATAATLIAVSCAAASLRCMLQVRRLRSSHLTGDIA